MYFIPYATNSMLARCISDSKPISFLHAERSRGMKWTLLQIREDQEDKAVTIWLMLKRLAWILQSQKFLSDLYVLFHF